MPGTAVPAAVAASDIVVTRAVSAFSRSPACVPVTCNWPCTPCGLMSHADMKSPTPVLIRCPTA
ncbi:hypothetical protein K351_05103, partial [Streptomyces sp. DpondAA-E10]